MYRQLFVVLYLEIGYNFLERNYLRALQKGGIVDILES